MMNIGKGLRLILLLILTLGNKVFGQYETVQWSADGNSFYEIREDGIYEINAKNRKDQKVFVSKAMLTPAGGEAIEPVRFSLSEDKKKLLIATNTQKVWRYDTRGDYWVFNRSSKKLSKIGKQQPISSLMFAKFSPDGNKVAYVSRNNIYVEDLDSGAATALTKDGTGRLINGTFDWVYEEEFGCRDGFRWSPDGKSIAYWQLDARKTRNYLMINNTDSPYPFTIPVEYPVVGEDPSLCRIGVVSANGGDTRWMNIPGDPVQHYIPRMEWANSSEIIVQQLNRRQNISKVIIANSGSGISKTIHEETETAWIDIKDRWSDEGPAGWDWINNGNKFIWVSEKGGWRQIYAIDLKGNERLITKENYDVISVKLIDNISKHIYFMASPDNATESYLYRIALDGNTKAQRLSPIIQKGTHRYDISPNGKIGIHKFSSVRQVPITETVSLPDHNVLIKGEVKELPKDYPNVEFFTVKTVDGIEMDGWMVKPTNFDPNKKYPLVFYVYGEPAGQTVKNTYGTGLNRLYDGDMANDGYIYLSVEGRGAPAPKGREWRKSIYQNIGVQNIRDQAMAAQEILKWNFVDPTRIAVWGWSGGGSTTLNLLFQYPDIYQTGISIAAVDNQLNYDNIYQERYMGLLPEDRHFFVQGSPITHAKNLKGDLLLIHGTGDDNVHYNNAEQMINELIKHGKTFQMMSYPNRSHSISEGEGTAKHLALTFTKFLREHCPPGGR
ncbi:peptidase S9B dipeptidylpeptidase IV domain protein [Pseudopedobacter saltans DSM 12145]|uniref:Peptidase S9B dipeptidylpeptidase IV domain protein n=1 Tax=Pseudopedobacter saltans (strain ATCC 51119 / DSM 12145 / JCM 21818 / CCUG 39354 / LMG 10337 / NBRC 100064 / NCIMB 13643) TaxID=762903 RepID=F0SAN9_PSESL|nr:S9 family peptidase [Pseudopedobacter saltans]ADY53660.1 peptidase S9B dipeptidylpeptidase IV domain protein [Pseudopedobacter saltans DSM 12145]